MFDLPHVPVVVMTSDKYIDALRPFAWLVNEYWSRSKRFVVVGFTPPSFQLPGNFSFLSLGKFEDYPVDKWSDALIKLLVEHMQEQLFILMLEDYWITRRVSHEAISLAAAYMERHPDIVKFDLCGDRLYAGGAKLDFDTFGFLDIVESSNTSAYHMSLMTGMWRKDLLLKVLKPGWSPWDVEIAGTTRLQGMKDLRVVGTRQWPIRHTLAFRSGDSTALKLEEIKREDVATMTRLGLLAPWGVV
jgi:hypothetical protein